jgi:hypothetical protein
LSHRKKIRKLNMQFIIFIYKKYRAILLSGLKIGKAFKMRKWISHLCRPLSRKFYVTSGNDVYSKMTQYGTSTTFSFTAKKVGTGALYVTIGRKSTECVFLTFLKHSLLTKSEENRETKYTEKNFSLS